MYTPSVHVPQYDNGYSICGTGQGQTLVRTLGVTLPIWKWYHKYLLNSQTGVQTDTLLEVRETMQHFLSQVRVIEFKPTL